MEKQRLRACVLDEKGEEPGDATGPLSSMGVSFSFGLFACTVVPAPYNTAFPLAVCVTA